MKNIKICYGKEIHMTKSNISYEELLQFIKNSFKKQPNQMYLYYKDQDQDNITISCDEDLKAMIETCNGTAKIFIDNDVELSDKSAQEYQQIMNSNIDMLSSTLSKAVQSVVSDKKEQFEQEKEKEQQQQSQVLQQDTKKSSATLQTQATEQEQQQNKVEFDAISCATCTFLNGRDKLFCQICANPLPQMQEQIQNPQLQQEQIQERQQTQEVQQNENQAEANDEVENVQDKEEPKIEEQEKQEEQQQEQQEQPKKDENEAKKEKLKKARKCIIKHPLVKKLAQGVNKGVNKEDRELKKLVRQEFRQFMPQIIESVKQKMPEQNKEEQNKEKSEEKQVVHKFVICDGCEKTYITGIRYKCAVCEDFDFCETCESTKKHDHPFLKIRRPELAPKMIFCALNEDNKEFFDSIRKHPKISKKFGGRRGSKCPYRAQKFEKEEKQNEKQDEKQEKNVTKHVFEDLITNIEGFAKDMFGKKTKQPQTQQKDVETKQQKLSKQISEILGGESSQYIDLVNIYQNKDLNELVRIAMDERDAVVKFTKSQQQQKEETPQDKDVQSSQKSQKSEKIQENKKLKGVYSKNVHQKASSISEILGGDHESYLGVVNKFLFSTVSEIIDMILEDPSLLEKYSPYQ